MSGDDVDVDLPVQFGEAGPVCDPEKWGTHAVTRNKIPLAERPDPQSGLTAADSRSASLLGPGNLGLT